MHSEDDDVDKAFTTMYECLEQQRAQLCKEARTNLNTLNHYTRACSRAKALEQALHQQQAQMQETSAKVDAYLKGLLVLMSRHPQLKAQLTQQFALQPDGVPVASNEAAASTATLEQIIWASAIQSTTVATR